MPKIKKYFRYIKNNATDEMKGFIQILFSIVCLTVFAIAISVVFIYFENLLKIIAYTVLGLSGVVLVYVVAKAIYDFIKLTVNYKK